MGRAVERLFRVINNEQPFACYIMKEVCLQSGISGLTFDPDTAAMFSTSKSSHFNRKASWKQHFSFLSPPHPPPNRQPQANLTPSKVTWAVSTTETNKKKCLVWFSLIFIAMANLTQSGQGSWLLQRHACRADLHPITLVCCIPRDSSRPPQPAALRAPISAVMNGPCSRYQGQRLIAALCLLPPHAVPQ